MTIQRFCMNQSWDKENFMEIKCYGICSENCMAWKDGQCAIHATCIDEVEELFKVVDDCVDNSKKKTLSL